MQVWTDADLRSLIAAGTVLIYNDFAGTGSGRGNILHRSSCSHVLRANTSVPKWAFASALEAEQWLIEYRGIEGVGWSRCKFCFGAQAPAVLMASSPAPAAPSIPLPALKDLASIVATYRAARLDFLDALGIPASNRDPLAEFAERLVAAALGGRLANSRVEKGYDVIDPIGRRVQVKYVANPKHQWINGHTVIFVEDLDDYALVLVEDLDPRAILIFDREHLAEVALRLGKRHPDQDRTLQLTRSNVLALTSEDRPFRYLGVRVAVAPEWRLE